jgi:large subunit ribosomal protein L15
MKLESLKPAIGSTKKTKRIGRGQGSGRGGTSTKGHKGAQSRSGYSRKVGFEGGQMPLQRRVPKWGFKNNNRIENKPINLDTLQELADNKKVTEVTPDILHQNGLIGKGDLVKVLGRGELKAKLSVTAHKFSKSAQEAIEKAGGSVTIIATGSNDVVAE